MKLFLIKKKDLIICTAAILAVLNILLFSADRAVKVMAGKMHVPILCVQTQEKKLALTFDIVAETDVDEIIKELNGEKATFFISEERFEREPQKMADITKNGYEIQLLEENLKGRTKEEIFDRLAQRIERTSFILKYNCDKMRFYNNLYDNNSVKAIYSLGLYPVQWSADSTAEYFSAGDIVRIEKETDVSDFVEALKKDGFQLVTVSELLLKENYKIDLSGIQISD